jgi:hypothetical protein
MASSYRRISTKKWPVNGHGDPRRLLGIADASDAPGVGAPAQRRPRQLSGGTEDVVSSVMRR